MRKIIMFVWLLLFLTAASSSNCFTYINGETSEGFRVFAWVFFLAPLVLLAAVPVMKKIERKHHRNDMLKQIQLN